MDIVLELYWFDDDDDDNDDDDSLRLGWSVWLVIFIVVQVVVSCCSIYKDHYD